MPHVGSLRATVTIPLTMETSYASFVSGLKPLKPKVASAGESSGKGDVVAGPNSLSPSQQFPSLTWMVFPKLPATCGAYDLNSFEYCMLQAKGCPNQGEVHVIFVNKLIKCP